MLVPPTFGALLTMSGSTPVPPGPALDFNKYFDVDDRTDDGWTIYDIADPTSVSGGKWSAQRLSPGPYRGRITKIATIAKGSKIRAKFSFVQGVGGGDPVIFSIYGNPSVGVSNTEIILTTNFDGSLWSCSYYSQASGYVGVWGGSTTTYTAVWLEMEIDENQTIFKVYDQDFNVLADVIGSTGPYSGMRYCAVEINANGKFLAVANCEQVSYTIVT